MKKCLICCLAIALCGILAVPAGSAESITLNGKTIPAAALPVYAPVSGTAETVCAEEGRVIRADETLYTLKTEKIYADRDGTVAGIFGGPGDDAETVSADYGAVMYLEEPNGFTISASTASAYNSLEAKHVHTGETVWTVSRTSGTRKGKGIITSVSGTGYTVKTTEGTFMNGESVDIYRTETLDYDQKIGRGNVSRNNPAAVTATGAIVRIAREDGTEVKRGDLLLETLAGTFDAYSMPGTEVAAGQDGVIAGISVQAGAAVEKGSQVAEIWPLDRMRAEAFIPEESVGMIRAGDPVVIELASDSRITYSGTVVLVSSLATETEESVTYRVVAEFVPDESVRFGMNVLITAGEEEEETEEPAENKEAADEAEAPAAEEKEPSGSGRRERRERPEGTPERNRGNEQQGTPAEEPSGQNADEAGENGGDAE